MSDEVPVLKPGIAVLKKKCKSQKKPESVEVDKKALEKAVYLKTEEMFGSKWHYFEDPRDWVWIQEE